MTIRLLWFVLAGFLLGFAASTLWEWFHFRRQRMMVQDARIEQFETQLAAEQEANAQLRLLLSERDEESPPTYSSPGVFLETETSSMQAVNRSSSTTASDPAETRSAASDAPVSAEKDNGQITDAIAENGDDPITLDAEPIEGEPVFAEEEDPAFEVGFEDDADLIGELAAELARGPASSQSDESVEAPIESTLAFAPRSNDFPDNLSKIKGIGDVYKFRLYDAGIFTWHQVAESDVATLRVATNAYPGANVDEWQEQARELAEQHGRQGSLYTGPIPDDLTQIIGIGPVGERTLYNAGICTYDQLASVPANELKALFPIAIAGDEPNFQQWIKLAIELAKRKVG